MDILKKYIKFNFKCVISSTWKLVLGILVVFAGLLKIISGTVPLGTKIVYVITYILSSYIYIFIAGLSIFIIIFQYGAISNYILVRRKFYISNIIVNLTIAFIASGIQSTICFLQTQSIYESIKFFIVVFIIYSLFIIINTVIGMATISLGWKVVGIYAVSLIGLYFVGGIGRIMDVIIRKSVLPIYMLIVFLLMIPVVIFIGSKITDKMEVYRIR